MLVLTLVIYLHELSAMIKLLKRIEGLEDTHLLQLVTDGAASIDVRSRDKFAGGHVKGSLNIPFETIGTRSERLKKYKHIVMCCRSGNRSDMAQRTLKSKVLKNGSNDGSGLYVNHYLN